MMAAEALKETEADPKPEPVHTPLRGGAFTSAYRFMSAYLVRSAKS